MNRSTTASAALLSAVLCSCGVTAQDRPEPLELPTSATPTSQTPAPPSGEASPTRKFIYLVRDSRLVPVPRTSGGPGSAIAALLAGPNTTETAAGTRTAIPVGTRTVDVRTEGSIAVLRLPAELAELDGEEQILAVAQLVFTVTERTGIDQVRLMSSDRLLNAPTGSGQLVSRPVSRGDYTTIAPK